MNDKVSGSTRLLGEIVKQANTKMVFKRKEDPRVAFILYVHLSSPLSQHASNHPSSKIENYMAYTRQIKQLYSVVN